MNNEHYNYEKNNQVCLLGEIISAPILEFKIYGEKFYSMNLSSKRLSDKTDIIPVIVSERLMKFPKNPEDLIGKTIEVHGQLRSVNKRNEEENKSHLCLSVFVKKVFILEEVKKHENSIILKGFICKKPIYRQTPLGKEITEVFLAVNRSYGKTDYIPCICWGRNAMFAEELPIGTELVINGRIQSRVYVKKHENGTSEEKVVYEVSMATICLASDDDAKTKEKKDENLHGDSEE